MPTSKNIFRSATGAKSGEPDIMLLTSLAQCTEPQQRVHANLFGPLKTETGKKYILCMTEYAEMVAVPNKESLTVAMAIFG